VGARFLITIAAFVGGTIGWYVGALVGTMTAFMISIVGTAAGVYVARRWMAAHL
jgi:hypothetical protein